MTDTERKKVMKRVKELESKDHDSLTDSDYSEWGTLVHSLYDSDAQVNELYLGHHC